MSDGEMFPPGTFCWVELGTTHASEARAFYARLLGWNSKDVDMGDMGTYIQLELDSRTIAGMYSLTDDQRRQGVTPNWLSYVLVDDADSSANRATELGGTVVMGPFDVPNVGRMAILQDPTSAVFALFEAGDHTGAPPLDNRPGMFCWNELATRNPDTAKAFYTGLFGWHATDSDGPMGPYTSYQNDGRLAGGMMTLSDEIGDVPPSWRVYFATDDCDRATVRARDDGGRVLVPPSDIPDIGRFSVLADPQGAAFALIALENAESNQLETSSV